MIGQFKIERPGEADVICTLTDELRWKATDAIVRRHLRTNFRPDDPRYTSPSVGLPGRLMVLDAVEALGGTKLEFGGDDDAGGADDAIF